MQPCMRLRLPLAGRPTRQCSRGPVARTGPARSGGESWIPASLHRPNLPRAPAAAPAPPLGPRGAPARGSQHTRRDPHGAANRLYTRRGPARTRTMRTAGRVPAPLGARGRAPPRGARRGAKPRAPGPAPPGRICPAPGGGGPGGGGGRPATCTANPAGLPAGDRPPTLANLPLLLLSLAPLLPSPPAAPLK